jgi:hypothetical protein
METLIPLVLENFTVELLVLGIIVAGVRSALRPRPVGGAAIVEDQFAWFLFFSIGVSYFYNFVIHVFFGETAARFIGWEQSPFQAEVGFASLGFSLVGFMAFRGGLGLRAAAVVGPATTLRPATPGPSSGPTSSCRSLASCCWGCTLERVVTSKKGWCDDGDTPCGIGTGD